MTITKRCPDCGRELVLRRNTKNGSEFLACAGWTERDEQDRPLCSHTEGLPASEYMRRAGASPLPGFDV